MTEYLLESIRQRASAELGVSEWWRVRASLRRITVGSRHAFRAAERDCEEDAECWWRRIVSVTADVHGGCRITVVRCIAALLLSEGVAVLQLSRPADRAAVVGSVVRTGGASEADGPMAEAEPLAASPLYCYNDGGYCHAVDVLVSAATGEECRMDEEDEDARPQRMVAVFPSADSWADFPRVVQLLMRENRRHTAHGVQMKERRKKAHCDWKKEE